MTHTSDTLLVSQGKESYYLVSYFNLNVIPVVFHNLSGYDAHFILGNVCNEFEGNIDLLPLNKERYISFTKHVKGSEISLRFIDSFRFMASSLDKLASYLPSHNIVQSMFPDIDNSKFELLIRKGIFPYEYIDSGDKLYETALPSKEKFYACTILQ